MSRVKKFYTNNKYCNKHMVAKSRADKVHRPTGNEGVTGKSIVNTGDNTMLNVRMETIMMTFVTKVIQTIIMKMTVFTMKIWKVSRLMIYYF